MRSGSKACFLHVPSGHKWLPWKFHCAPRGFWNAPKNQVLFLEWLGKHLGYKCQEDWYQLTAKTVQENGGNQLLKLHRNSPLALLSGTYPGLVWVPWKFKRVGKRFWDEKENHKRFLDWLGRRLGFQADEDWYKLTGDELEKYGASRLLRKYNDSLPKLIEGVYPEKCWLPWKFDKVPHLHWESGENCRRYLDWLTKELHIQSLEDWYRVSMDQIRKVGPITPFMNGMDKPLLESYPHHEWDVRKLTSRFRPIKATQRVLASVVREIFPGVGKRKENSHHPAVYEDSYPPGLEFTSGAKMQLDVFAPKLSLAFEYQGEQHYFDVYQMGAQWQYVERDKEKRDSCKQNGITLIEVPYWWDLSRSKLEASIHDARPDLVAEAHGTPIEPQPPS